MHMNWSFKEENQAKETAETSQAMIKIPFSELKEDLKLPIKRAHYVLCQQRMIILNHIY